MMKFTIENGRNNISIGLSEIGSYFRFNYPKTVVWYDCRGSIGKYFCTLPYNKTDRNTLSDSITKKLKNDFSNDTQGLYDTLKPMFQLFKNGTYTLDYYPEEEFFKYKTSTDNYSKMHTRPLGIQFSKEETNIAHLEEVKEKHRFYLKNNEKATNYIPSDILEFTTSNIYDGDDALYATQSKTQINQERVQYFENKIQEGERPFAIILNAYLEYEDEESAYFILDGHHKLLAYQKLGIHPPIVLISHLINNQNEVEFDVEKLSESLYPWQTEHILKHWDEKDQYIETVLKNPESPLHSFIKNGLIKRFHKNGILKHEAFYINDKVEGPSKSWHENGQIAKEEEYKKGLRVGTWKWYYPSGQLQFIQPFNEKGHYHGHVVSYYENGKKNYERFYENNKHKDEVSTSWYENGDIQSQLIHKNGRLVGRKNWNSWGEFVNHEIYNEATKQLEKVIISENEKYDVNSTNYKNRQEEINKKQKEIILPTKEEDKPIEAKKQKEIILPIKEEDKPIEAKKQKEIILPIKEEDKPIEAKKQKGFWAKLKDWWS